MFVNEKLKIRNAEISDLSTLLRFEQQLITYERPFAPRIKKGNIHYYDLEAYINDSDICVVVADYEEVLVGSGYALIKPNKHYKNPEYFVYLGFMYVLPEFRGYGINSQIIQYLIDWGKNQGYTEYQLEVFSENKSAIKAYQKAGFIPELMTMRMPIED